MPVLEYLDVEIRSDAVLCTINVDMMMRDNGCNAGVLIQQA